MSGSQDYGRPNYSGSYDSYNTGASYNRYGNQGYGSQSDYASQGYGSQQNYSNYSAYSAPYRGQNTWNNSQTTDWGSQSQYQRSPWSSEQGSSSYSTRSGRAPKGYKRSDERIKEEICDLLTNAPHIDPSELEVKVSSGEVTLSGTVEDRQEKRMAEDLASTISGVTEVHNQLRVQSQSSRHDRYDSQNRNSHMSASLGSTSASSLSDSRSDSQKSSPSTSSSSKSVQ